MNRRDDKRGSGDATEVVSYDEASRRRPASAPKMLGRYQLDRVIAQGGMAEIWLATVDVPGAAPVVLKRIRPSLVKMAADAARARNVEMFVREAKLLASLDHKNIVKVVELGIESRPQRAGDTGAPVDEHFIVMEYLEGLTLRDLALRVWQAKRPLPLEVVVAAVADACLGLDHAHNLRDASGQPANLVHRDISPDNLFLAKDGVTKLLDFGIAKREDWSGLTVAGEIKGKVPYMSPEQLKGERVDARTDIFSVGVVLYWLLTGRRPFDGPSDVFTMKAILDDAPRPLRSLNPQVPPLLETIILSCLEKDPAKRTSSAAALYDSLSMVLMGASGLAASASEVVAAASALPPCSFELVPDVAAVPVQRWAGSPTMTVSRSPIPAERDVSQMRTEQMGLESKVKSLGSSAKKTVVGSGDTAETHFAIDPSDIPPPPPPAMTTAAPSSAEAATAVRQKPPTADAPTLQREKRPSWKDQVPPDLRDTVDLGPDQLAFSGKPPPPPAQKPVVSTPGPPPMLSQTLSLSSSRPPRPQQRPVLAAAAGVVVALVVLGVLAIAIGAIDNPFVGRVVVDAGRSTVVVDAGTAVRVGATVDAGLLATLAGAADAGALASVAGSDAGSAPLAASGADAGEVAADAVDAGAAADLGDAGLPDGDPPEVKNGRKKKTRPKQPPPATGVGQLIIRVRPWAKVSIDGHPIGTTPLPPLEVAAGRHRVRLQHDAIEKVQFVDVLAGQATTIQVDMKAP